MGMSGCEIVLRKSHAEGGSGGRGSGERHHTQARTRETANAAEAKAKLLVDRFIRSPTFKVRGAPLAARPSDRRERLDRRVRGGG